MATETVLTRTVSQATGQVIDLTFDSDDEQSGSLANERPRKRARVGATASSSSNRRSGNTSNADDGFFPLGYTQGNPAQAKFEGLCLYVFPKIENVVKGLEATHNTDGLTDEVSFPTRAFASRRGFRSSLGFLS